MTRLRMFAACAVAAFLQNVGPAGAASFSISGFVWLDANANKQASVWEPKVPGATVKLMNPATNTVIQTATADASGKYIFSGIPSGGYRVGVSPAPGYLSTTPDAALTLASDTVKSFGVNLPATAEEKALNAFGDRWSLAKPNSSLQRAVATGCYRRPAAGTDAPFTQQELQFLKQLAPRFYLEACAVVLENNPPYWQPDDSASAARLQARVAQIKAVAPSAKYIGYQMLTEFSGGQVGFEEIYYHHRDWFVYKKGATTQEDEDVVKSRSGGLLYDMTNPAYQDFIATRLAQALPYYKIDGVVLDLVSPVPRVSDLSTVPDSVLSGWGAGWLSTLTKLKAAFGPNRFVFASVQRDNITFAPQVIPLVDGIVFEDTFSPVSNEIIKRIKFAQPTIDAAAAAGKWIITTENTKVDGSAYGTTTPAKEHALASYYLSAFYIFSKGKMLFYYNTPAKTTPQYGSEPFFTSWNIKVGAATGPYVQLAGKPDRQGVYKRNFANAIVYLNASTSPYTITVPNNSLFKFDPDGKAITSHVIPPKSGYIVSRAQALH